MKGVFIDMIKITKAQRVALKRVYDRGQRSQNKGQAWQGTYREFRAGIVPGPDCIMIRWAGMWLGIETDGYTHS